MSLWILICAPVHSHVGTGSGHATHSQLTGAYLYILLAGCKLNAVIGPETCLKLFKMLNHFFPPKTFNRKLGL